jgi:hypothetical protein
LEPLFDEDVRLLLAGVDDARSSIPSCGNEVGGRFFSFVDDVHFFRTILVF